MHTLKEAPSEAKEGYSLGIRLSKQPQSSRLKSELRIRELKTESSQ